jgi:hypothetical protein
MSMQETQNTGSQTYVRVVGTLMVVLIGYGILNLMGIIR